MDRVVVRGEEFPSPVTTVRQFLAAAALGLALPAPASELFDKTVRPLVAQHCLECHSAKKHKGDLDLERFSSLDLVRAEPKVWQGVADQIAEGEMPPKDAPQPASEERERLLRGVNEMLEALALERAGDPGPVVLRRLSNAEYSYTVRDLTGVESLDPAREFPVDGAAGEGFMNTGNALVMSPALLTKYLDAGKAIASHAVLLPSGLRFSPSTTRRDWTEETLAGIRAFYSRFTEASGGDKVNLQGIVFETNEGGRLPLERYLAATIELREAGSAPDFKKAAEARGLSPKYLETLWNALLSKEPSLVLDLIRARWQTAKPGDAPALARDIARWQTALFKFNSVGHIGKAGGPKGWMEAVSPLATRQEVRLKLSAPTNGNDVVFYLTASDAGDGHAEDSVIWERPRLVAPGRPDLLLRDVRGTAQGLMQRRAEMFANIERLLAAAADAAEAPSKADDLARQHKVDSAMLAAWLNYLGLGGSGAAVIEGHFTNKLTNVSGYNFVNAWGSSETPSIFANSSDQPVRIPGNMPPHSVAVHPSPTLRAAVAWRSPVAGKVRVEAAVTHAHPECGNGTSWLLEVRRGSSRQRLAAGNSQGSREIKVGPFDATAVQPGDVIALSIGPRGGNHSCDLTQVGLVVTQTDRAWDLAVDVSRDLLAANPQADRFSNDAVWHFFTEPDQGDSASETLIPPGSILARWQNASAVEERSKLALELRTLLDGGAPKDPNAPDAKLHRQLSSLGSPLLAGAAPAPLAGAGEWGLDPAQFGQRNVDAASLSVRAPSVIEVRLPADLAAGAEFVTTGVLHPEAGEEASVQLHVLGERPNSVPGLVASAATIVAGSGPWTSDNRSLAHASPILVKDNSAARTRIESALNEFRALFPAALCYPKIVPVDEVVTLTLFYREDHELARLMLDDAGRAQLDRLWDDLHFISQDALTLVDAFEQLWQYATQDADPKVFEPLRKPIQDRAASFRSTLAEAEPRHVSAVIDFAARADRRPLEEREAKELSELYGKLRAQEMSHEEAIRLMLARVFVAPQFLYRLEQAAPGRESAPVTTWELATRLSYFLWSSLPDAELLAQASSGSLSQPDALASQARRMLTDPRARRLAIEFGCQWLHIHGFDSLDEKSERHFPSFAHLRADMYEESIQFFTDFFQNDRSVLSLLDSDHTFLNEELAAHYGIADVKGAEWRRVDGLRSQGRGGVLAQASVLARQSGASRTSPILRGNWVAEVLLGDKLPRPPKDVPRLPEDEATETLTVRQLTEKHSTDPRCASCHIRIDPFGYALESFDAIGRKRDRDLGGRAIDTRAKVMDGAEIDGLEGLRDYLLTKRRDAFVNQFCRKLLGYALGRAVQLSDRPLLAEMRARLKAEDYKVGAALDVIVRSRQFREIRGRDLAAIN